MWSHEWNLISPVKPITNRYCIEIQYIPILQRYIKYWILICCCDLRYLPGDRLPKAGVFGSNSCQIQLKFMLMEYRLGQCLVINCSLLLKVMDALLVEFPVPFSKKSLTYLAINLFEVHQKLFIDIYVIQLIKLIIMESHIQFTLHLTVPNFPHFIACTSVPIASSLHKGKCLSSIDYLLTGIGPWGWNFIDQHI